MTHDHSQHGPTPAGFWRARYAVGLLVMGAIAAYFLLSEHRAHFFGALPFLFGCLLMQLFMYGGDGGHGGQGRGQRWAPKAKLLVASEECGATIMVGGPGFGCATAQGRAWTTPVTATCHFKLADGKPIAVADPDAEPK